MTSKAYDLGLDAGRRGSWFHETLDSYLGRGLVSAAEKFDFYRGYWGDMFDVRYENGKFVMVNRGCSPSI